MRDTSLSVQTLSDLVKAFPGEKGFRLHEADSDDCMFAYNLRICCYEDCKLAISKELRLMLVLSRDSFF